MRERSRLHASQAALVVVLASESTVFIEISIHTLLQHITATL